MSHWSITQVDQRRVTDLLVEYCRIDSAPLKERRLLEVVRAHLEQLGFSVYEDDAAVQIGGEAGNLIATKPGRGRGQSKPAVMFSAHFDRVAGGLGVKPVIKDDCVYSDGTTILGADDAAGLAAIVEACTVLEEHGHDHPPIELVLTVAEEIGLVGAEAVDVSGLHAEYGYVLDAAGPVGSIVTQAPTQYTMAIHFTGRAAHAGVAPEKGVSAIKIASDAVSRMRLGRIDSETTANVGYIAGGGPTNIVADRAEIRAEARSLDQKKAKNQVDEMIRAANEAARRAGGDTHCEVETAYVGYHLAEDDPAVRRAFTAAEKIGLTPQTTPTGGGSDANVFNEKGVPTAVLCVGYQAIHTYQEHMPIDELVRLSRLVLAIIDTD